MPPVKKENKTIKLDLSKSKPLGVGTNEIVTFGPKERGRRIYIDSALIEDVSSFLKKPNGTVSKFKDNNLLKNVLIYVLEKEDERDNWDGYSYNYWLEDKKSKHPGISTKKVYGFTGPKNVVLEITFSSKFLL